METQESAWQRPIPFAGHITTCELLFSVHEVKRGAKCAISKQSAQIIKSKQSKKRVLTRLLIIVARSDLSVSRVEISVSIKVCNT